jgi:RimJ/RimL family protein N-acetyltransferase
MILLRPFSRNGFARLIRWIDSQRALVQWAGPQLFRFPLTVEQLERYCGQSAGPEPASLIYEAVHGETGSVVGHCELGLINREQQTASACRILIDPAFRGQGICRPMVEQLLKIGFGDVRCRRIDLRVYALNNPAIRCYEAAGFVREGVLREGVRVGEELWDVLLMGILCQEWKARANERTSQEEL